jgi:hypothetical protein
MQPADIQAHELLKLLYRRPKVAVAVRIAMLMRKKEANTMLWRLRSKNKRRLKRASALALLGRAAAEAAPARGAAAVPAAAAPAAAAASDLAASFDEWVARYSDWMASDNSGSEAEMSDDTLTYEFVNPDELE